MRRLLALVLPVLLAACGTTGSSPAPTAGASPAAPPGMALADDAQIDLAVRLCQDNPDFGREYNGCKALLFMGREVQGGRAATTLIDRSILDDLMAEARRRGLVGARP